MTTDRAPGITVVLSPPPTPNGPLHLGHLAGPYVAADIAVRAARRRGETVFALCGLDDHQNYVLAKARQQGSEVRELRDQYAGLIRGVFDRVGVGHDGFTEPLTDPDYRTAVAGFLGELVASGTLPVEEWRTPVCGNCPGIAHHAYVSGRCPHCDSPSGGGTCEGCGSYTPADALADPRCTRCGSPATGTRTVTGPVIRLEDYRGVLQNIWYRAALPPRVRALAWRLLRGERLPTVPLSYPTDWGIETDAFPGQRIDVWAEMGLGYLCTIGRHLAPGASGLAEHVQAWRGVDSLWTFLGLDNAFYYLALFPALFAAAQVSESVHGGLVVNEFYRLDGAKFSTSRGHAVWAHELLEKEDPRAVRAFLSWDRPAPHATNFTLERFHAATSGWTLTPGPGGPDPAELARAEQALTLEHFDSALAARCLLGAPGAADGLLEVLTGGGSVAGP
ncbi:class I tRNA ligase family protein [Streptomyces sp. H10-C2]|uniref:class I tRNA ligase family protein n=1 Tax=unclassified Streptomyces TaxID=2593676 RepID=UPI0024B9889F|nr:MULTISPECIES: class I tRNA ligase family protein [unclassified Streptomyces]MDJ0346005.1 class I tRNA ligase family protein [Streptomyces sp. PH10-H1]MDJ0370488.1 class I tRNA ligase family protein [Streptomyces sp. H10-C2]